MRVIVATDLSHSEDVAVALASGGRWPDGTILRLVHAIEPVIAPFTLDEPAAIAAYMTRARRDATNVLDEVAKGLARPDRVVEHHARNGYPADVIVEEAKAWAADLVVVGSRGRGAIAAALLGSVSEEIIDRAPCPVLVARGPVVSSVLFADDGSPSADVAARLVGSWPILRACAIRVLSVVVPPVMPIPAAEAPVDPTSFTIYEAALSDLRARHRDIERARTRSFAAKGITVSGEVAEGRAADELERCAAQHGADLIVVGTRGARGLERLFMGSVARAVLHRAHRSVLVVRPAMSGRAEERAVTPVAAAVR